MQIHVQGLLGFLLCFLLVGIQQQLLAVEILGQDESLQDVVDDYDKQHCYLHGHGNLFCYTKRTR